MDVVCKRCGAVIPNCHYNTVYCNDCRLEVRRESRRVAEAQARARRKKENRRRKKPPKVWTGCVLCGGKLIADGALYCVSCSRTLKLTAEQQIESMGGGAEKPADRKSTVDEIAKQAKKRGVTYGQMRAILEAQEKKKKEESRP